MNHLNLLAILAAAAAAVVLSTAWYMAFGRQMAALHPAYADPSARPPAWKVGVELVRSFVLAFVVAFLVHVLDITGLHAALHLALLLWLGFPVVLWTGAIVWERVPPKLAAIHAGDWLLKLIVVAVIVTMWQ